MDKSLENLGDCLYLLGKLDDAATVRGAASELAALRRDLAAAREERDENARELDETVRVLIATRNLAAEKMRLARERERRLREACKKIVQVWDGPYATDEYYVHMGEAEQQLRAALAEPAADANP